MYGEADEMLLACFPVSLDFAIFLEVSIVGGAKTIIQLTKHRCLHWGLSGLHWLC